MQITDGVKVGIKHLGGKVCLNNLPGLFQQLQEVEVIRVIGKLFTTSTPLSPYLLHGG